MANRPVTTPSLPSGPQWLMQLIGVLAVAYVIELIAANAGVPVDAARWQSFAGNFQPWQLVTRFAVQGREAIVQVLVSLLMLWFIVPPLLELMPRKQLLQGLGAGVIGSTVVPVLLDAIGLLPFGTATGWTVLLGPLFVLFGLRMPNANVLLFFVLPVSGATIVWGTLALEALFFLASPGIGTMQHIGAWLGVYLWWTRIGPGARREELVREADSIMRELKRFEVIEGGRGQNSGNRGDDTVH